MRALEINQLIIFLSRRSWRRQDDLRARISAWLGSCPDACRVRPIRLIEPYELEPAVIYHIDLYRLTDPDETDDLGLAELPGPGVVMLVEWPERAVTGCRARISRLPCRWPVTTSGILNSEHPAPLESVYWRKKIYKKACRKHFYPYNFKQESLMTFVDDVPSCER